MHDGLNGKIFVISAPSAGGKTTIINRLIDLFGGSLKKVITCTTRAIRDGEKDGVDYRFLSVDEFDNCLKKKAFFEHAKVYGNMYGVLKEDLFAEGHRVISLDSKGVENFKKKGVEAKYILVIPPSLEVLEARIKMRASENEADMKIRLAEAKKDMEQSKAYDFVVVNDKLDKAIEDCEKIMMGEINK
ncbi:MAG: Guanylate kinase [Chlamydiia bacterium]|nr:Guanylate kinase [Chlamydiia bacterium]